MVGNVYRRLHAIPNARLLLPAVARRVVDA